MLAGFITRFRRRPLQTTLLSVVMGTHLFFLLALIVSPHFAPRKKEHKHLIVKTLTPKPVTKTVSTIKQAPPASSPPKAVAASPKPQAKKETAPPKPQPLPEKKQPLNPTPTAKKEPAVADKKIAPKKPPSKKPAPVENRANISDSLLRELEESIAKIDGKSDKTHVLRSAPSAALATPSIALQIDSFAADSSDGEEGSYTERLIAHLHHHLSLPDYGEVKIQLSLRQDGSVAKVVVLKAQSEKNRQYLESHLPRLGFPRFEGIYQNRKEHTFVLTFCNELCREGLP